MKIHRNFATAAATKSVEVMSLSGKSFIANFQLISFVQFNHPQHEEKNFQTTWDNAKPFSEVPGPSILQMLRNFLPGGNEIFSTLWCLWYFYLFIFIYVHREIS